jgi:hypothetical protein
MFLIRGFVFTYEAVRDWEAKLTPALAEELRRTRKGKVGRCRQDVYPGAGPMEISVSRDRCPAAAQGAPGGARPREFWRKEEFIKLWRVHERYQQFSTQCSLQCRLAKRNAEGFAVKNLGLPS